MTWFLTVVLAITAIIAVTAVVLLIDYVTEEIDDERSRIDLEVRRAERRLHDIASRSFEAMLAEARSKEHTT